MREEEKDQRKMYRRRRQVLCWNEESDRFHAGKIVFVTMGTLKSKSASGGSTCKYNKSGTTILHDKNRYQYYLMRVMYLKKRSPAFRLKHLLASKAPVSSCPTKGAHSHTLSHPITLVDSRLELRTTQPHRFITENGGLVPELAGFFRGLSNIL